MNSILKLTPFQPTDFDTFISWVDSKELLLTIAGDVLTHPVTHEQLDRYLDDPKSHSFTVVDTAQKKSIGHAEIIIQDDGLCKIDKLLIGDTSMRGKGLGQQVIELLLEYAFITLSKHTVELNVFTWNEGAIRCYEKCGFRIQPNKEQVYYINNESWKAVNMRINKEAWSQRL